MSNQDFIRQLPTYGANPASIRLYRIHLDPLLFLLLITVLVYGLVVLFSAVDGDRDVFRSQTIRIGLAFAVMVVVAQIHPRVMLRWAPVLYGVGVALLVCVLLFGVSVKGSQRWLQIPGVVRFQPSELMKLAVPMMVAWYLHEKPLPPGLRDIGVALAIIAVPVGFIVVQPDLGTGILIGAAGAAVVVLSGIYWRWLFLAAAALAAAAPALWYVLKDYQRRRIMTLFDPESDPLGAGWNIMQSTTAIGSGGVYGKGLFGGTQSRLDFLPESRTDFILAVIGEELGLIGVCGLLALYVFVIARGLIIAAQATNTFERLLCGGLTLTFFVYVFVNVGMVCGLLPVVGVPLPLVSFGGTSVLTLMAGFGIIMSIRTHKAW